MGMKETADEEKISPPKKPVIVGYNFCRTWISDTWHINRLHNDINRTINTTRSKNDFKQARKLSLNVHDELVFKKV